MPIRSPMTSIMGQIEQEQSELFALEFGKLLNMTVYTLSSTNINQSEPNLVKMYVNIRSQMSSIMDRNIRSYLPLNVEKLLNLTLFTL